jgi:hypothetical protein
VQRAGRPESSVASSIAWAISVSTAIARVPIRLIGKPNRDQADPWRAKADTLAASFPFRRPRPRFPGLDPGGRLRHAGGEVPTVVPCPWDQALGLVFRPIWPAIVAAWGDLPNAIKANILATVEAPSM